MLLYLASIPLVVGTVHELVDPRPGADVERPDALGGIEFMAGYGQQIHPQIIHARRYLAHGLGRIGVKGDGVGARNGANGGKRLERADFVVGMHDGDEKRIRSDGGFYRRGVYLPHVIDRQAGGLDAETLQKTAHFQDGRMLDGTRDQVAAAVRRHDDAFQGMVVGLRTAARKDDRFRRTIQEFGDLAAGVGHGLPGCAAIGMAAGGVAERRLPEGLHGVGHFGCNGCRSVVVQIDRWFHNGVSRPPF